MSMVILLDAGPLGLITNPKASQETRECNQWLESLAVKGILVKIPEIADFEVRRELLRADKFKGIERLNDLQKYLDYVPLTTQTAHDLDLLKRRTWLSLLPWSFSTRLIMIKFGT
ncbi:MAG: hypothetical protein H0V70_21585 [Ktedonobacteraceae bacterium]|nr:hypothetical protein [Ktedonobacteraceae bacterium]